MKDLRIFNLYIIGQLFFVILLSMLSFANSVRAGNANVVYEGSVTFDECLERVGCSKEGRPWGYCGSDNYSFSENDALSRTINIIYFTIKKTSNVAYEIKNTKKCFKGCSAWFGSKNNNEWHYAGNGLWQAAPGEYRLIVQSDGYWGCGYPYIQTSFCPSSCDIKINVFPVDDKVKPIDAVGDIYKIWPPAQTMAITVSTDKAAYSPGDTALISGSVSDLNGALAGVAVSVDVSGTILSATTDASGNYHVNFPIPADVGQVSYPTTATATYTGYPSVSANTIFSVQNDALIVELSPDKDYYLMGKTVYLTIIVKDSNGNRVPGADLDITTKRLGSGNTTNLTGSTDGLGENVWSFIWGQDANGNTIAEGKLQIDVIASKDGYANGSASKILSGCGDRVHDDGEDCFICSEDCACGPNEVCDPSSDYKDTATMCSPKVACIFISNGLDWRHKWFAADDINGIRKKYRKLGYKITPNIYVDDIYDVAKYLSRPSTKAIAYAGHGPEAGKPGIESMGSNEIPGIIYMSNRSAGSFLYRCRYEIYADKWVDLQNQIKAAALAKGNHPELDYVFMFSCFSLDNFSLRDYLLKSGGTYWGYRGVLPGSATLSKSVKP